MQIPTQEHKKPKIEFTANPSTEDEQLLIKKISKENYEKNPYYCTRTHFGFFVRNENSEIIAGCTGLIIFGAAYTDLLWVDKNQRKTGVGKQLMEAVHEHGQRNGCKIATIQTMSFQDAVQFYEKLGYVKDFERTGYINNSSCIFMSKQLNKKG
jgi:GNAT superfamily N-acetyltransferase